MGKTCGSQIISEDPCISTVRIDLFTLGSISHSFLCKYSSSSLYPSLTMHGPAWATVQFPRRRTYVLHVCWLKCCWIIIKMRASTLLQRTSSLVGEMSYKHAKYSLIMKIEIPVTHAKEIWQEYYKLQNRKLTQPSLVYIKMLFRVLKISRNTILLYVG